MYFIYDTNGVPIRLRYTTTADGALTDIFYMTNWRGDVIGLYDAYGNILARYEYDAWGNIVSIEDASGNAITDTSHIAHLNPLRYRSYYYDTESGLYYLMSRYYDPVVRRFISSDNILDANSGILQCNIFAYCANNPVMNSDPTGHGLFSWIKKSIQNYVEYCVQPALDKIQTKLSSLTGTWTRGAFLTSTVCGGTYSFQLGNAIDTNGNTETQLTIGKGKGTGAFSHAAGLFSTFSNAPTVSEQTGAGITVGGSVAAPLPLVPVPVGAGFDVNEYINADDPSQRSNYYGYTSSIFAGSTGIETHYLETETFALDSFFFPSGNVFDGANAICQKIMEW